jgi:hypothetical protein
MRHGGRRRRARTAAVRLPQQLEVEMHEEGPNSVLVRLAHAGPERAVPFDDRVPADAAAHGCK